MYVEPAFTHHIAVAFSFLYASQRRNITLNGYLDTYNNMKNIYGMTYSLKYIYIYISLKNYGHSTDSLQSRNYY